MIFAEGTIIGDISYILYFFGIQAIAVYYFLTAGENPGFVDETESEESKRKTEFKMKVKM